jgi:Telomerase activating protein Est1
MCVVTQRLESGGQKLTLSRVTEQAEKELLTALALKEPTFTEIAILIAKYEPHVKSTFFAEPCRYRTACETAIFRDFSAAAKDNTEYRLWSAHSKINSKYRSRLTKFRDAQGNARPVERRKLEKRYLDFIKSSMRFYKGYIQRLASHFKSPKEVLQVAHKLHLDSELAYGMRTSQLMKQHSPPTLSSRQVSRRHISFLSHAMTLLFA